MKHPGLMLGVAFMLTPFGIGKQLDVHFKCLLISVHSLYSYVTKGLIFWQPSWSNDVWPYRSHGDKDALLLFARTNHERMVKNIQPGNNFIKIFVWNFPWRTLSLGIQTHLKKAYTSRPIIKTLEEGSGENFKKCQSKLRKYERRSEFTGSYTKMCIRGLFSWDF